MMSSVCLAEDVTIRYDGTKAKVKNKANDSVTVAVEGAHVSIESKYKTHKLTLRISGKSDDGQLVLKTAGKAKVSLDGLSLTSQEGAALWLKKKKKVEVKAVNGTKNTLTVPFSFRGSASIITSPAFKQGSTYTLKTKDTERIFTLKEPFTVVR